MQTTYRKSVISGLMMLTAFGPLLEPTALGQVAGQTHPVPEVNAGDSTLFLKTLNLFLKLAAADQELRSLLSKHCLTVQYSITDLGFNCYVGFIGGAVVARLGQPPKSEIAIKSDRATLDRVLRSGTAWEDMRVTVHMSPIRKFKLSRDLDRIKAAFSQVYTLACDKVQGETALAASKQ